VLPANARLRRRDDFTRVVRSGRRVGRGALVVHVAGVGIGRSARDTAPAVQNSALTTDEPASGHPARAGFVVSRAVGPAVTRNLVERRLRHLVRERLPLLPPGADVVVRALPAAATRSYAELAGDLDAALGKAVGHRERVTAPAS
jgi:ribonuclease P protein component